jgi:Cu+-exporting ATPase
MQEAQTLTSLSAVVEGMSCASCAAGIERFLRETPGVIRATVNFPTKQLRIDFRAGVVTQARLQGLVEEHGYRVHGCRVIADNASASSSASSRELRIAISGMSCASCAARIEGDLSALHGVSRASVNFAMSHAVVTLQGGTATSVVDAIVKLGYGARIVEDGPDESSLEATRDALEHTREISSQRRGFFLSLMFTVPIVGLMIVELAVADMSASWMWTMRMLDAALATPVVVVFGAPFFRRAAASARHRTFTMDTLISTGVGSMYIFSLVALVLRAATKVAMKTYFDTAAMLVTFMLLGKFLEARAKRSTGDALIRLMDLAPKLATLITPAGDVMVPSAALQCGDRVRVLAGDAVPVDGAVCTGTSDVDERMLTGESLPRSVRAGDRVVGGTTNLTAAIVVEATKVGEETVLSQILRIVSDAQTSKPAIQKIADAIAGVFVPCVIGYSLAVLAVWLALGVLDRYPREWRRGQDPVAFAFSYFAATVVAACPCALGLATPTALMVGTGVGASNGILIKSGETLEIARRTTCVVFDKTGTITKGTLRVAEAHFMAQPSDARARSIIAAVEAQSTHPVAAAVVRHLLRGQGSGEGDDGSTLEVLEVTTHSGSGVVARVLVGEASELVVHVGSLRFLHSEGVSVSVEDERLVSSIHLAGSTTVCAAIGRTLVAVFGVEDEVKEEAADVVGYLRRNHNMLVMMVSGDHRLVVDRVAELVGIGSRHAEAETSPAAKAAIVRRLQEQGHVVAFVGDGINDSPALAQSDVGAAIGAGTDVAIDAASVVLCRSNLVDLLTFLKLSSSTVWRIRANFFWAFAYNMVMLPFASGVLYPALHWQLPALVAGVAMICSSLCVLGSSLLLYSFEPVSSKDIELCGGDLGRAEHDSEMDSLST